MKQRIEAMATAITLRIKRFLSSTRCPTTDSLVSSLLILSLTVHWLLGLVFFVLSDSDVPESGGSLALRLTLALF